MTKKLMSMMTAEQAEVFAGLLAAAESGDGDAACVLGDMYREGLGGLKYSPQETYRWYARSALLKDPNGQNNLGACYEHGLGCRQSYRKAVKWYRASAAQGFGTASMNLGCCYVAAMGLRKTGRRRSSYSEQRSARARRRALKNWNDWVCPSRT